MVDTWLKRVCVEEDVNKSTTLSLEETKLLLSMMSIGRHSLTFWSYIY
jgi:hypothetical protein